jgi:hypothetical protein
MPDKPVRALDPLGIIALANVLVEHGHPHCSCELKCVSECSCELKCVTVCSCELKPVQADLLDIVTNPVFREVVKGLDINKLKSIEDFLSIADEIRAKMDSARLPTRSTKTKKPQTKKKI